MSSPNLYWPVYKNLEEEFLKLAGYIHFSDDQLGTYSMFIADLIVRCAVEIEALSKELYRMLGRNMSPTDSQGNTRDLYFDTDCLDLLEKTWLLGKKQIAVSAINYYCVKAENRILTPLHKACKRGASGSKWKQAYQAVKHDKRGSLKKASIENLLHAMGALYILNLYYQDERIDLGRVYLNDRNFDNRLGSDIFSAHYCYATSVLPGPIMDDSCIISLPAEELQKSIYIIKIDDVSFKQLYKNDYLGKKNILDRFTKSPEIKNFLRTHPEYARESIREKTLGKICIDAGGMDLFCQVVCDGYPTLGKGVREEVILNKHSGIYPKLTSLEDAEH